MAKQELYDKITTMVEQYNELKQAGNFRESGKLKKEINKKVNEYTNSVRTECFNECMATENPMVEACKRLTFESIKVAEVEEEFLPVMKIDKAIKKIDLLKMHTRVESGIGADKNWNHYVEKFNFLMTIRVAKSLKEKDLKKIRDCYAMSDFAKQAEMGKDLKSDKSILEALDKVVKAMIGDEYSVDETDVEYLKNVYCKDDKKNLGVICSNHKYMRMYIMKICKRLINGEGYITTTKQIEEE